MGIAILRGMWERMHTPAPEPERDGRFSRSAALLGSAGMRALASRRVILFGLGGVGGWCAEALIRTGVRNLTMVDPDRVCASNVNRQLQALESTLGQFKADALRNRMLDINPNARINVIRDAYTPATEHHFDLEAYDIVADAIDTLDCKALLLNRASRTRAFVCSAFGAARKLDPARVRTAEFQAVKGCPLGARLRKIMRREHLLPEKDIRVVYSDEARPLPSPTDPEQGSPFEETGVHAPEHDSISETATDLKGSLVHMTGIFGLTLAGLIIRRLLADATEPSTMPTDGPATP